MEGAVFDGAIVLDRLMERAVVDGARCRILDFAVECTVIDDAVVLDCIVERTVFDHAVVLDCAVEGTVLDGARCPILDFAVEGAAVDDIVVLDCTVKRALLDGAIILDLAVEGTVVDGVVVLDCIVERALLDGAIVLDRLMERAVVDDARCRILDLAVERTVFDHAVVLDCAVERAVLDDGARYPILDRAVEGAAQNAAVVDHFAVELAASDGRRLAHKDFALHRRTISDGAEIVQPAGLVAARQKQHVAIGRVIFNVLPAVALAGDGAAVGSLRVTALHDEVGAGDCSVQHHVLVVRHGKGHGRLVAAVAAFGDGLAVQAEDLGVGGDGHFLVHSRVGHDNVGGPIRRHTVDFLDLGIGGHGDVVAACYPGQVRIAVEHAASDDAVVFHLVREGAARDRSIGVVFHTAHVLEGAVLDGAVVYHPAHVLEGAVLYGAVVCHTAHVLEGAVLDGAAVCHTARFLEGATRDYSSGVVCHFFLKGAAGNCRRRLNRALHRLCGAEIILSTRQSQCLGAVIVTPAGATARDGAAVGILRPAVLHDEVGAGDRSIQHHGPVRHGEFHGVLVAVDVVALAEELAVQAEDLGVGFDGHFLARGQCSHNDVGVPIRRHTVDFLDLGIGVGRIPGDVVATCYPDWFCIEVEHTAGDGAAVCHSSIEGAFIDIAAVCHTAIEGAVLYGAVVCHTAREGAANNFCRRSNHNRARHRLCPRSLTGVLGMGGTEIIRSTRQNQCVAPVLPAVALGAVRTGRPTVLHDEVAGAEHHVRARHGKFHGRLFACIGVAAVVGLADGVAVQAVDFGAGGDGHFLRRGRGRFSHDDVGGPIRRHTVDFLDLGIGGGRIPGDGVDTCYPVQTCFAVEHAAVYDIRICHTAREGAASDFSVAVYHCFLKGSARDRSGPVLHYSLKGSVRNRSAGPVSHCSIKGAFAIDVAVVCHLSRKGTAEYLAVAVVCHIAHEDASRDLSVDV